MPVSREMPKYQCHKRVYALKIAEVLHNPNPDATGRSGASSYGARIVPADAHYAPIEVDAAYVCKHVPQAGGYYVVYEDGYKSFSPADAFEGGYAPLVDSHLLSFGAALNLLKTGAKVARLGWNGKGMWLALSCNGTREVPAANFWAPANREWAEKQPNGVATVLPSITMKTATGEILMGWLASQTDMLAEDWVVVPA